MHLPQLLLQVPDCLQLSPIDVNKLLTCLLFVFNFVLQLFDFLPFEPGFVHELLHFARVIVLVDHVSQGLALLILNLLHGRDLVSLSDDGPIPFLYLDHEVLQHFHIRAD